MLGLLTGNIRLGAEIKLRRYGLWEIFEFGGFADDHEDRNHIAAAALERGRRVLGKNLRPEEIVVVGDTPFDIRCGKFIGAKVLAVATGGAKLDELRKHAPDWAIEDLTRVSALEIVGGSGVSPSAKFGSATCRPSQIFQCPWQWPPQHPPPPLSQDGASLPPEPAEANTENFLDNFFEPQCGHAVPFQSLERTRVSLSRPHFSQ